MLRFSFQSISFSLAHARFSSASSVNNNNNKNLDENSTNNDNKMRRLPSTTLVGDDSINT